MKLSPEQFERLALEHLDMLYRVARRLTRDPHAAEDLVQETYLRAVRAREGFDLQAFGIRPWLLRILHNVHVSRAERERRQPVPVEDPTAAAAGAGSEPLATQPRFTSDPNSLDGMDQQLVRALEQLPAEYQTVLLLWAVEGLAYKEIAQALEIPIGTVMSRLHRARQRLGEQLRDYAVQEGILRE